MNDTYPPDAAVVENDLEQVLPWYASTQGPGISKTVINIAGNVLPMLNLVLASHGVVIGPAWLNLIVTLAVFGYFSIQAVIGYARAKQALGSHIVSLRRSLNRLQASTAAQNKVAGSASPAGDGSAHT